MEMKKIKLLLLCLLLVLSMAFVGCSKKSAEEVFEPKELVIWTTDSEAERIKTLTLILDTWSAISGNTYKLIPVREESLKTGFASAVTSKTLPDIVGFHYELFTDEEVASLINWEANREAIELIGEDFFTDGILELAENQEGDFYMVPFYGWTQGIWYRKDWFEAAGLDAPTTWDSIIKAAEYFNRPEENVYGILIGTDPEAPFTSQVFTQIAMANNAFIINSDGELVIDSPEMKESLAYYARLAKYTPPGIIGWRARDYYLQGHLSMMFYSTYILDDLAIKSVAESSLSGENFQNLDGGNFDEKLSANTGFVPVISTDNGKAGYGSPLGVSIFSQDEENAKVAANFIAFLMQKDNYISFVHTGVGGMIPTSDTILEAPEFLQDPGGVYAKYDPELISGIAAGLVNAVTFALFDGKSYPEAGHILSNNYISNMIGDVLYEGKTVDEATAEYQKKSAELIGR